MAESNARTGRLRQNWNMDEYKFLYTTFDEVLSELKKNLPDIYGQISTPTISFLSDQSYVRNDIQSLHERVTTVLEMIKLHKLSDELSTLSTSKEASFFEGQTFDEQNHVQQNVQNAAGEIGALMDIRSRIWNDMLNAKFKYYYLDFVKTKFFRRQRLIDMGLLSVAVIGASGWGISERWPLLWGGAIIVAHFFAIYKPYFDFGKYVHEMNVKITLSEAHINEYEKYWHECETSVLDESIKSDRYFTLRKQSSEIHKLSDEIIISKKMDQHAEVEANSKMKIYLKNTFGISNEGST